jgi:hypothetical protein
MRIPSQVIAVLSTITTLAIFASLNPSMPTIGLDPSWMLSMNEAVAMKFRFGKDILFTFGPYASIYTQTFHPGTDQLMVFAGAFLGVAYAVALLRLSGNGRARMLLFLTLFLASVVAKFSRDGLLLSYPFLLAASYSKNAALGDQNRQRADLSLSQQLAMLVTLAALGLLPLVKGSLLVPSGALTCALAVFFLFRFPTGLAFKLISIPFLALVGWWVLAGQSVPDLAAYLGGIGLMTYGYSEAMSLSCDWPDTLTGVLLLSYGATVMMVSYSIIRTSKVAVAPKVLTGCSLAVLLLISFKAGFVRCDSQHILTSFTSLAVALMVLCLLYTDRHIVMALTIAMAVTTAALVRYDSTLRADVVQAFGTGTSSAGGGKAEIITFVSSRAFATLLRIAQDGIRDTYVGAWRGLVLRTTAGNTLRERFALALAEIRIATPVPVLTGTTDIYSYEQAVLLASGNKWNPRPVIQSFAAYSPELSRLNECHLRDAGAPDNVLIAIQTIDGRLPSLDDGMSWPALLDNYVIASHDKRFVYLRRVQVMRTKSAFDVRFQGLHRTGAKFTLPKMDGPAYIEVDLKATLLGRLLMAAIRPPELRLILTLGDGTKREFRVIAGMMRTGFFVSPLVTTTDEFALLMSDDQPFQKGGRVESISIAPSYGGSLIWADSFQVTVKEYHGAHEGLLAPNDMPHVPACP